MSLDSRPLLPRAIPNPANLHRLRQQALLRLAREEHPDTYTRRWSLQRLALLTAGLSPAIASLLKGHRALAATPRCNAPQYGAPPMYRPAPPPPYPDYSAGPSPIHALPATRAMLGSLKNWTATTVEFLGGGGNGTGGWGYGAYESPAWSILYTMPGSKPFPFTAIVDNYAKVIHFVRGNHDFYGKDSSGIYAVSLGNGVLLIRRALFRFPGTAPDIADAVSAFAAETGDKQIRQDESRSDSIDITPGIPFEFWSASELTPLPTITYADLESNGVYINLLSPDGKSAANIFVNVKDKKVIRTTLNNKIVYGK